MINYLITFILVLLLVTGGKTFSQSTVFEDGEELYYEVYYAFINVGWVKFNTEKVIGKKDTYECRAKLKSNDAVPFINVDYEFKSRIEINNNTVRPVYFESRELDDSKVAVITYNFNYDSGFVDIKKVGFNSQIEYSKRLWTRTIFQDGLSIFYFARYNFTGTQRLNIPVLINQDSIGVALNYNTDKTDVNVDDIKYDISSLLLEGNTDYELVYGLTGNFEGWFSNDNSKIPLKAKFKVKIGNVTLELKSWKRQSWTPPKF